MTDRTCSVDECRTLTVACGMCGKHYRNVRLYGRVEGAPDPVCETCGETFTRPGRGGPLPRYCSRDCNPAYRPRIVTCKTCGQDFDRGVTSRVHCTEACMNRWRFHGGPVDLDRDCYICGRPIDFHTPGKGGRRPRANVVRCSDCRRPTNYATTVADLVERDGTSCALCGEDVDLTVKWPHGDAPTRDHVIPHSLGGSDDPSNLQLAHARCNRRKGNRVA